ncbi:pentatricopeptide repeat-containing protein At1g74900, mitochondrial [Momordica charantia]|uniref:Pentatricopeptide repeat-containing protein At1g74900, mitochondrial n=1 Tax=Momordica charantia TaxID=3673 RepID=A0A6J1C7J3_MOMCH|nr:pentatricopeptide repeat-containing protein At1g74900, mitochondrial [Momordica charantia]XP_022137742.1 pentatricopeptide repeat-containing protein At1g74900, mitochondrial [Momordica charantia]XP_022137743.1 pentatricopeptide repeat-containing protein At1g74900, mitochondrial [Momordica charantia]XP_022137744.1 pentatricopeptide repeat-containing protein At1g74900, mitochondrial [Momordica charantia]
MFQRNISRRVSKTKIVYPQKRSLLILSRSFITQSEPESTSTQDAAAAATAAGIANLVLESDPRSLRGVLHGLQVQFTPELVDKILKRLWFHGPKALQFFKHLEYHPSYAHSSSSFDRAIDIAGRLRDYKTLWALVARMRARRLGPSPKTFAIIAERFVGAGKPDRAIRVFLSMREHGCRQDLHSFNTILDILCKSKRVEMAYNHLFKVLRGKFKADVVSYNIIANGWCLIKRTPKALEILKEMVERGMTPTITTYNILLKGYFRAGQIKEAWEFFLEMKERKVEIDVVTYTTMVHGFGVVGEIKRARKVFDEMVGEGVLPSTATYNAMIQVLCKKDSVENAVLLFEEMMKKGYVPNLTTYNVVIRGLCHVGNMERAMEFMERMRTGGCEPNVQTYNVVIRYFCDAGDIEKGLDVFEKMGRGDCLPNMDTYNVLISAMFVRKKSDDLVVAGKLLLEMIDRGFLPRKFTFNRVLNGLLLTGNQAFANEILRLQSKCGRLPRKFKL